MFKSFVQTVLLGVVLTACSPAEKQQTASTPAEQSAAALSADKLVLKQALQDLKNETGKTHQQMLTVIREPDSAQKTQKVWQLIQESHQQELAVLQKVKLQHSQPQLSWQTLLNNTEAMANLAGQIAQAYGKNDVATGNQLEAEYGKHNTEQSQALAELGQLLNTP